MGDEQRKSSRYRVGLSVRYATAEEFVREYAYNLSQGGIFINGAHHLTPLEEVRVEVALPGAGTFRVTAEVAHIIDEARARSLGRRPGAGLAIKRTERGFQEALLAYLHRLGRRAETIVMVTDEKLGLKLGAAGYLVQPAPPPDELAAHIARSDDPIAGVVVRRQEGDAYRRAAASAGAGDVVLVADEFTGAEELLARLDQEL